MYDYYSFFTWPVEMELTKSSKPLSANLIHTLCENPKTKKLLR
jgi:hypothetical protein